MRSAARQVGNADDVTATNGFGHLYVETHDFGNAVAFWTALGFELEFDTGHGSGALRHPAGGAYVFVAEQPLDDPLAIEAYLDVPVGYEPPAGVTVVSPFRSTHWGTEVMIIQDPDGHRFRLERPTGG